MSDPASEVIFHAYPQSPVAEKVRVVLGIKGVTWRSVENLNCMERNKAHPKSESPDGHHRSG